MMGTRNQLLGAEDDAAFHQAVNELMGFDLSSLSAASPYLSAFASGFGGGGGDKDKAAAAEKAAKEERDRLEKEKEAADARARTTLWVVIGLLATTLVGTGVYLAVRKKSE